MNTQLPIASRYPISNPFRHMLRKITVVRWSENCLCNSFSNRAHLFGIGECTYLCRTGYFFNPHSHSSSDSRLHKDSANWDLGHSLGRPVYLQPWCINHPDHAALKSKMAIILLLFLPNMYQISNKTAFSVLIFKELWKVRSCFNLWIRCKGCPSNPLMRNGF